LKLHGMPGFIELFFLRFPLRQLPGTWTRGGATRGLAGPKVNVFGKN
jgi:hypothetical protein